MRDQSDPANPVPPGPATVNRRGRRLIISTAPGGVIPAYNAAISPATVVAGKAVGVSIGFRISEASRERLDELIDEAGMTLRSFLVQVLNEHLSSKGRPPLDEPLFAHRRQKRVALPSSGNTGDVDEGIDLGDVDKAILERASDKFVQPLSPGDVGIRPERGDDPSFEEALAAVQSIMSSVAETAPESDMDKWMRENSPRRSLDQVADEIVKLVGAGYDWPQIHNYLRTVRRVETTPEFRWEWWQRRKRGR